MKGPTDSITVSWYHQNFCEWIAEMVHQHLCKNVQWKEDKNSLFVKYPSDPSDQCGFNSVILGAKQLLVPLHSMINK